ncbi:MAG: O-antigen ligase family protein, partial [Rhodoferax sp.]|nr:O-antigen ligase family protein [Rhodoferax sp.]
MPWLAVPLLLLALGRVHSHWVTAGWLLWCLLGAWFACRWLPARTPDSANDLLRRWVMLAVLYCVLAILPTLYWGGHFRERTETWRLLYSALATWAIVARLEDIQRLRLQKWVLWSAVLACVLGYVITLLLDRTDLKTNPIPWAMGQTFWLCLLWPLVWLPVMAMPRWLMALALVLGGLAVLNSESRGAFWIFPWLAFSAIAFIRQRTSVTATNRQDWRRWIGGVALGSVTLVLALQMGGVSQQLLSRILLDWNGWQQVDQTLGVDAPDPVLLNQALRTSMGLRRAMWADSWQGITEHPWSGEGQQAVVQRLQALATRLNTPEIATFRHMHNEYLHDWLAYGVWGLGTQLMLLLGLLLLWRRSRGVARWQLAGIGWMHALGSFTNVNFVHTDYSALLG